MNEQFPVEVREYLLDPSGADGPLLSIVHLGADYVVVNKPDGLLSAPGRGDHKFDSVKTRIQQVFPEADGSICIHRLDMDTSGLLVLALNRRSHRAISRQFEFRKTGKTYMAVLQGIVEEDEGAVELPLIVDWPNRPRQMVDHKEGRPAKTLYRVRERDEARGHTRIEFRPLTGRTHQLRVHSATAREDGGLGCPIMGDTLYGDPDSAPRLLLHADHLAFWEPVTGDWKKFNCPPPF